MKNARPGFFGLLGLLAACSSAEVPATELVVAVHADTLMAQKLSRVRVRVYPVGASADAKAAGDQPFDLAPADQPEVAAGEDRLPFSFAIRKGKADALLLVVEGFVADKRNAVVEQKVTAGFTSRQSRLLKVYLSSACYQRTCTEFDQTCDPAENGECGAVPAAEPILLSSSEELTPPADPSAGSACTTDARDCGGAAGAPRLCEAATWTTEAPCTAGTHCSAGSCVDDSTTAGDGGVDTDCGVADACVAPGDDCLANACAHGVCVDGDNTFTCTCDPATGYAVDPAAQACVDIHECDNPAMTVCQGMAGPGGLPFNFSYPCSEQEPFYRCVGQMAEYPWQMIAGGFRFTQRTYANGKPVDYNRASADNVVFDHITNLEWEEKLTVSTDITWEAAKAHCATVTTAGGGFRTPSYVELLGLVDDTRTARSLPGPMQENVAFDETLFPGPHDAWYWTQSSRGDNADSAYIVLQINGVGGLYGEKRAYADPPALRVRCVRDALTQ